MIARRWLPFIAWDAGLPLLVTLSLDLLRAWLGRGDHLADFRAVFIIPMFAALFRCALGMKQLSERGVAGWRRQILLATAIVVLMLFEGLANALRCDGVPPGSLALFVAALYAVYLLLIWATFRAPRSAAVSLGDLSDAI